MAGTFKVALIGGTSHAGKSTTARLVAERLGGEAVSTDSLARHPGRPWPRPDWAVPPHVAEHYGTLPTDELFASVLEHYGRMWPMVRGLIEARVADPAAPLLVLEGSALWPAFAAELTPLQVRAVWLTAEDALLDARIARESRLDATDPAGRQLIEAFAARTRYYNAAMLADVRRLALPLVEVTEAMSPADVADRALAGLDAIRRA